MTPADLKAARAQLRLTAAGLGRALELEGKDPGRSIRLWEAGRTIPGPARVAIRLMLADQARQTLQEAMQAAQAILDPAAAQAAPTSPPAGLADLMNAHQPKTRRRGR